MLRVFFDLETDGLLDTVSKTHCICAVDLDSDQTWSFGPDEITEGVHFLSSCDLLAAHNGIGYDFPVLEKLYGFKSHAVRRDTMVLARLAFPNTNRTDETLVASGRLEKRLRGSDSLKAWGQRVGEHKADYDGGWGQWSQEMQDYCLQDCLTGKAIWTHLKPDSLDQRSVELEHRVSTVTEEITRCGWPFNTEAAQALYTELVTLRGEIEDALVAKYGSWQEVDKVFTPKRDNKTLGYLKGVEVTKYKTVTFNPGSRKHIIKKLKEAGWKPTEFTETGEAKLDEEILEQINLPGTTEIIEYLIIQKRLGQLADGAQGWLRKVKPDGRIHARYKSMGTVTGRSAHSDPNIAQVPKVQFKDKQPLKGREGKWTGWECRALFGVPKGWKLVGADYEGLELRCLAHYMAAFDGGEYGNTVINGDIHTVNQMAAGLPTRDSAKTFCYGWLYGAGDAKIGSIIGKGAKEGKALKEKFLASLPALGQLVSLVKAAARRGYLKGLDGRHIPIRSDHAALNSLLQSCGAILCKTWLADTCDALKAKGLKHGWDGDFVIVGWIHDEVQIACKQGLEDMVQTTAVQCAKDVGPQYNFKCQLDSGTKVGDTWRDTH